MATQSSCDGPPDMYIIVHNVAKAANIGTLARCATAFGVKEFILVGPSRNINTFGAHGAAEHVTFRHFKRLEDVKEYLHTKGVELIGIEIDPSAQSINDNPFRGPTAFMLGNEGIGMSEKQMATCDRFVYIPQHGAGTASLNVAVAASIVMHRFSSWAGYQERAREGQKFVVDERPQRTHKRGTVPLTEEELEELREARARRRDGEEEGGLPDLFGESEEQEWGEEGSEARGDEAEVSTGK